MNPDGRQHQCIDYEVIDGVCANNFAGLCDVQGGVNKWALKFDSCMESKCGAGTDQDIYGRKIR
jgi:hypothetical protein